MSLRQPFILIVEDDQDTASLYSTLLAGEDMEVLCLRNGEQTLSWWHTKPQRPDLLIMDVRLPDMDGLALFQTLRSLDEQCPPVLVLSAHGDPRIPSRCRELGAASFLDKLKDMDHFISTAKQLLKTVTAKQPK